MKTISLLIFNLLFALQLNAQENGSIIIYEDANFGASYLEIDSNWQAKRNLSIWDDKISSIRIPEGTIVVIYENVDFSGAHKVLSADWKATEENAAWNDKISAIRFFDDTKPYGMVYNCYLQNGTKDSWSRTNDFILNDNSRCFFGADEITNWTLDTLDMSLLFTEKNGNRTKIIIDGNDVFGWVQKPNGSKQSLYGHLIDLTFGNYIPLISQNTIQNTPLSQAGDGQIEAIVPPVQNQYPLINYSEGVRVFKTADFTGESRYVDEDWSFGDINNDDDFFDWWRQIKSIRVPKGWAIVCYRGENFSGTSIQITGDWIPANDPNWNEDIRSIKILRKGVEDAWGNLLNPAVTVYKKADFTGESRYVDKDWSFGDINNDADFFDWWRQIKSIRVPKGWAIVCYRGENFSGTSIQITSDWVPANDPDWNENIKSIKIVRAGGR